MKASTLAFVSRLRRKARTLVGALGSGKYDKLFVVGCPRSGTTWITQVLSSHPRVIGTGESHIFPRVYDVVLEADPASPELPARLIADAMAGSNEAYWGVHQYVSPERLGELACQMQQLFRARKLKTPSQAAGYLVRQVFDEFFRTQGGGPQELFVEKTPTHLFHVEAIRNLFPEARFVQVLRDGRDVCVSLQMRAKKADWAPADRAQQIHMWRECVEYGLQLSQDRRLAGRLLTVRFEDFKQDFARQCAALYEFCGLNHDRSIIDRAERRTDFSRVKLQGEGLHHRKGVVGDWREHFTAHDEQLFEELAGETFRQCGYAA